MYVIGSQKTHPSAVVPIKRSLTASGPFKGTAIRIFARRTRDRPSGRGLGGWGWDDASYACSKVSKNIHIETVSLGK